MVAPQHRPVVKSVVISDPTVMSGDPVVGGARVLAESIVANLRAGYTNKQIFEDFPTLPVDGIDAVIHWADKELGVLDGGSVEVRVWNAQEHDLGHVRNPDWR